MWRTTVFLNMDNIQNDELHLDLEDFDNQKNALRTLDGNGRTVEGFEIPNLSNWPIENFIIKRDWNSEQHARAFGDLVASTFGQYATITVEEQV